MVLPAADRAVFTARSPVVTQISTSPPPLLDDASDPMAAIFRVCEFVTCTLPDVVLLKARFATVVSMALPLPMPVAATSSASPASRSTSASASEPDS